MAELALISGLVGVVGAGSKLSILIFDFAASIGSAGKELQHVATEISDLCSVLKQLQAVLEHAHFRPSAKLTTSANRIIEQCQTVFAEMDEVVSNLRKSRNGELFPSVDFISKVKWVFLEKSKMQVLRSTLEACKTTLSVMLMTMMLAERISHRTGSSRADAVEEEQDRAMTQNLIIAQQCALEELELSEDRAEREEEALLLLPPANSTGSPDPTHGRRKSRSRLARMFSGLSVVTDLPTPRPAGALLPTRSERASVWLDAVVAPDEEEKDPHPGRQRQRRLSSIATANAPMQLLRKWTDLGEESDYRKRATEPLSFIRENDLWQNSSFVFPEQNGIDEHSPAPGAEELQKPLRMPTDLISPKTARVHSIGFHLVAGVDGGLSLSEDAMLEKTPDDSCEAIILSILGDHGSAADASAFELFVLYAGKQKRVGASDKPLQVLSHYEELDLEPRLVVRRKVQANPG